MPKILISLFLVVAAIIFILPANAQELIESYQARLSERDHFNSNGERLTSAAAIIRQDRANFFRFGKGDDEDEPDSFFADMENRAILERLIERGSSEARAIAQIVNRTPLIQVDVIRGARGNYVNVMVLD